MNVVTDNLKKKCLAFSIYIFMYRFKYIAVINGSAWGVCMDGVGVGVCVFVIVVVGRFRVCTLIEQLRFRVLCFSLLYNWAGIKCNSSIAMHCRFSKQRSSPKLFKYMPNFPDHCCITRNWLCLWRCCYVPLDTTDMLSWKFIKR